MYTGHEGKEAVPTPKKYTATHGRTTWRVRFRLEGTNTSETFVSKVAAEGFCRDLVDLGPSRAVRRRVENLKRNSEPCVDDVLELFLTWKAARVRSDRTVVDYRREYDNWIRPTLGHRVASAVTAQDVQAWVDGMIEGTIRRTGTTRTPAPKSIKDRHALLHSIMSFAANPSRRIVAANPCTDIDLPKHQAGQPKGLRPAEWQALHQALTQINADAADLSLFLLASGWRWSEAAALSSFDVEDDGVRLWVTMGQVVRRNAAGQNVIVEEGKGAGSIRRVELDAAAAQVVRERVSRRSPGALVFTTGVSEQNGMGGSQWHYSNFKRRYWDKAVTAANLHRRPTPHWLRHTAVFWLTLSGSTMPELQSRIGHRNIATTINVYGRMLTDVQPDALSRFAAMRTSSAVPSALAAPGTGPAGLPSPPA